MKKEIAKNAKIQSEQLETSKKLYNRKSHVKYLEKKRNQITQINATK